MLEFVKVRLVGSARDAKGSELLLDKEVARGRDDWTVVAANLCMYVEGEGYCVR